MPGADCGMPGTAKPLAEGCSAISRLMSAAGTCYGKSVRMQEGNMLRRLGVLDVVLVIGVVVLCVVVAIK
jgi:hypothetical protein